MCGNAPDQEEFFPCDLTGRQIEPTPTEWPGVLYVCERCGRIIDAATRIVRAVRVSGAGRTAGN